MNIEQETLDLIAEARADILSAYLDENIEGDFSVSFSAGKDSTVTLKLVIETLESMPQSMWSRKIHVVCSDTMVETPLVHEHMVRQVRQIKEYVESKGLPMTVQMVVRDLKDSYFYCVIGRGNRLPDNHRRWCTQRMKIKPQDLFMKNLNPAVVITGVRSSESATRQATYTEKWQDKHDSESKVFMPILNFTVEHVWRVLEAPLPWGSSIYVRNIYREATGECGFSNPKATDKPRVDACGARFGCWVCPVVTSDKSTEQMMIYHPWLTPLTEWRKLHMIVSGQYETKPDPNFSRKHRTKELRMWEEINKVSRYLSKCGHDRKGNKMIHPATGKYMPDWGAMNVEARRFLLEKLLETQVEVNELRADDNLEPVELISQEEINMILNQIADDERERPWMTTGIKKFGDVFERKMEEIKTKHLEHWEENPIRCIECRKLMKIIKPGVQKCQKCGLKAQQGKLDLQFV